LSALLVVLGLVKVWVVVPIIIWVLSWNQLLLVGNGDIKQRSGQLNKLGKLPIVHLIDRLERSADNVVGVLERQLVVLRENLRKKLRWGQDFNVIRIVLCEKVHCVDELVEDLMGLVEEVLGLDQVHRLVLVDVED
jgi:hypothetical protein